MNIAGKLRLVSLFLVALIVSPAAWTADNEEVTGEDEEATVEEIVVTGIRGSIGKAQQMKRDAALIMDGISAEDINEFPDQNIAEALQRVTGVAISRDNGEGRFVSIRGLGPDFNKVLFNGRTMATENEGRAFSFDVFASELISGVQVVKSPTAGVQEGWIGGLVNITTARPLDLQEFEAAFSASVFQNDLEESSKPWLSGLVSKQFNDRFGALVSVAYSDIALRRDEVFINGWRTESITDADTGETFADVRVPQNYNQALRFEDRKRLGVTGALQFRPTDALDITIDAIYSDFDVTNIDLLNLNNLSRPGSLTRTGVSVAQDGTLLAATYNGHRYQTGFERVPRTVESYMLGGNASWDAGGALSLELDLAFSEAEQDDRFGTPQTIVRSASNATAEFDVRAGQAPALNVLSDPLDPTQFIGFVTNDFGRLNSDEIFEADFKGLYRLDTSLFSGIEAGIVYTDRSKEQEAVGNLASRGGFFGVPLPASIFDSLPVDDFLNDEGATLPRDWLLVNPDRYADFQRSTNPEAFEALTPVPDLGRSGVVDEEVWTGFVQLNFESDSAAIPFAGNIGVRIARTSQTSSGFGQTITGIDPDNGQVTVSGVVPVEVENDYTNVLPSANIRFNLMDDLVLRLAAASTMTRPTLSDLSPAELIVATPGAERIIGGNPELDPFEADQFDASLEWYFAATGSLAVAYFYKDVENFISEVTVPETILGVTFQATRPRNGGSSTIKGMELAFSRTFDFLPEPLNGFGVQANYTYADSDARFNNEFPGTEFPAEGVSEHSYNLILFYENDRISARIAYNYRDEFLENSVGLQGNAEFVDDFGQLDASLSFNVNDWMQVFFEGINLTDEEQFKFSDVRSRLRSLAYTGRRLQFGVRARF